MADPLQPYWRKWYFHPVYDLPVFSWSVRSIKIYRDGLSFLAKFMAEIYAPINVKPDGNRVGILTCSEKYYQNPHP